MYLVRCLYYLYQWCTVKQISDNEIYFLITHIKSVLFRVAKRLSYIEDARCLNRLHLPRWGTMKCLGEMKGGFRRFVYITAGQGGYFYFSRPFIAIRLPSLNKRHQTKSLRPLNRNGALLYASIFIKSIAHECEVCLSVCSIHRTAKYICWYTLYQIYFWVIRISSRSHTTPVKDSPYTDSPYKVEELLFIFTGVLISRPTRKEATATKL